MATYNAEDYIREAIDSVINQSFDLNKVQLIIVDDGSTDSSKEIALEYQSKYPNSILVLSKENGGQASARNYGMNYIEGKYVNFMDSDDMISKDALTVVNDFFNENKNIDLVSIPMFLFERREGPHFLTPKFTNENRVVNLLEDIYSFQLHSNSSFIKKEVLIGHTFDTTLAHGEDSVFVNEILIDKKQYGLVGLDKNAYYMYRKRFSNDSTLDLSKQSEKFFTHKIIHYFKHLIDYSIEKEGYVLEFIQAVVVYGLQWLSKVPEFPSTFTEEDIDEFWSYFSEIMDNIDEKIILEHKFIKNKPVRHFLLFCKLRDFNTKIKKKKKEIRLKTGNHTINKLHMRKFYFDSVDFKDGILTFEGSFTSYCDIKFLKILAEVKSKNTDLRVFEADYVEDCEYRPSPRKYLSIPWKFVYNFSLKIPINKREAHSIKFKLLYEEDDKKLKLIPEIQFREWCNINEENYYVVINRKIIIFEDELFYILPHSYIKLARLNRESKARAKAKELELVEEDAEVE